MRFQIKSKVSSASKTEHSSNFAVKELVVA